MKKTLNVIKPYMHLVPGDTFELNDDGTYTAESHNEYNTSNADDDFYSAFDSAFTVSEGYAKKMIEAGILKEDKSNKDFVNVFDEIDNLIQTYTNELKNLDADMANSPECLKVEKTTVLQNLIKTLDHLKNLRK